jgi:TonB family protein
MNPRPIIRPEAAKEVPSQNNGTSSNETFLDDPVDELGSLMKILANAGGGSVSRDLALDLVLNEFVQQAREATRATGAAIALDRDGEMICRATTGNAPELGARLETTSGLSAAALLTGTFQECVDTENDPRVDADGCRQLQLRSMLLFPIAANGAPFGLIEVFSAQPNNFGSEDLKTLQQLAGKIAATITQAQAEPDPLTENATAAVADRVYKSPETTAEASQSISDRQIASGPAENPRTHEVLSSALFVLVIAAAVLLGVVIGVREFAKHSAVTKTGEHAATTAISHPGTPSRTEDARAESTQAQAPMQQPRAAGVPVGGLIVTQNGKVIYRADPGQNAAPASRDPGNSAARLLRRVAPQYPEAAKSQGIHGPVVLQAQVLPDGTVGDVTVLSGNPLLAQAASTAVKQWKYAPYVVKGRPVDRLEQITVTFNLPSS